MKRITVDEVLEAYRVTGFKPARKTYCTREGDTCALCALSVLAVASGKVHWMDLAKADDVDSLRIVRSALGLTSVYTLDFMLGFDGDNAPESAGYADGQACAAAVFQEESK